MAKKLEVTLTNGVDLSIDPDNIEDTISSFIEQFLKPYYKEMNDWNRTIQASIKEIERISSIFQLGKGVVIHQFLKIIESRLSSDIAELTGLDKIEILFENIDDYVENIHYIISSNESQEEMRLNIARLLEKLNLFEISELVMFFAKKKI